MGQFFFSLVSKNTDKIQFVAQNNYISEDGEVVQKYPKSGSRIPY